VAVGTAGFLAFMAHIHSSWLEPSWEQEVKLAILVSHQGNTPISDWIMLLESMNTLWNGHVCKLSKNDLHNHIQSHIHADTMMATMTVELHLIASYDKYKRALKVIDDVRIRADNLLKAAVKQLMLCPPKCYCTLPGIPLSFCISLIVHYCGKHILHLYSRQIACPDGH